MASKTYFNRTSTTNKTGYWNKNSNTQANVCDDDSEHQENVQNQEKNMVGFINVGTDSDELTNLFGILNEFRKNNGLKYTRGEGIIFFSIKSKFLGELSKKTPFKISKFKTRSDYQCDSETANSLLKQKDSFIRMNWDADTNTLTFMSRTHAKIHGNLIRRIFKDASETLDTANYKVMKNFGTNNFTHSSQQHFSNNDHDHDHNHNDHNDHNDCDNHCDNHCDDNHQNIECESNNVEQTNKSCEIKDSDGFECVKTKKSSKLTKDTKHFNEKKAKDIIENEDKPSKPKARGSKIKKEIIEVVDLNDVLNENSTGIQVEAQAQAQAQT